MPQEHLLLTQALEQDLLQTPQRQLFVWGAMVGPELQWSW